MERYHPDSDQRALATELNDSIAEILPLARLHDSYEESAETWAALEGLGVFGIAALEDAGGSGLGAAEESLIALELGRRLASPAVLATLGASHARTGGQAAADVGAHKVAAGYRNGDRVIVVGDGATDQVLVRGPDAAALYATPTKQPLDGYLWAADLQTTGDLGAPAGEFDAAALLRLRLIDAAALAGVAQAALDMAVEYAGIREQFGRPIGTFQAVKHHCANMAISAGCARDQTTFAAVAIDDGREDAALQVESAFLIAANAAIENAGKNIQIHGGIGFSDEADPHLLIKRAQLLVAIGGGVEVATARVAGAKSNW